MNIYIISLIATILFGLIDGIFFLFFEDSLQKKLTNKNIDQDSAELLTGGLSSSCAIFVSSLVTLFLHKHYAIIEHPGLDALGVMIGTFMIIGLHVLFKKKIKKNNQINKLSIAK